MGETIVFCIPGKPFTEKFLFSWTNTIIECSKLNLSFIMKGATSANVFEVRNKCLDGNVKYGHTQKPFQGKIKYDYIMWIDSDQVWSTSDFKKMISTLRLNPEISILTGIYPRIAESDTSVSTLCKIEKTKTGLTVYRLIPIEEIEKMPELTKVDASGLGFCVMRYGVMESLEYPWFSPVGIKDDRIDKIIHYAPEDISLFMKLKEVGFDLWCNTTVRVGHEKHKVFTLSKNQ